MDTKRQSDVHNVSAIKQDNYGSITNVLLSTPSTAFLTTIYAQAFAMMKAIPRAIYIRQAMVRPSFVHSVPYQSHCNGVTVAFLRSMLRSGTV